MNGPLNFESFTCWPFSSATIFGDQCSLKAANFSVRLALSGDMRGGGGGGEGGGGAGIRAAQVAGVAARYAECADDESEAGGRNSSRARSSLPFGGGNE